MNAWTVLATCGLLAAASITALARRHGPANRGARPRPYIAPPITDDYVNTQFADLEQRYHQEPTP